MAEPPKLAEWLLRWLVGGRDADAVACDLREQFADRGRLWYWGQVLSCAAVRFSPHRRMLPASAWIFTTRCARSGLVDAVLAEAPDTHLYEVTSVLGAISVSLWQLRWQAGLLGGVATLAVLLAAIGLYGVVAGSVAQRTREIGVRTAIGAQPGDVQWMFVGQGLRIGMIGIVVGIALSVAVARLLRAYLYGLSPFDPVAFAGASLAWIAVGRLASWWPARRATRVDPLTALKYE